MKHYSQQERQQAVNRTVETSLEQNVCNDQTTNNIIKTATTCFYTSQTPLLSLYCYKLLLFYRLKLRQNALTFTKTNYSNACQFDSTGSSIIEALNWTGPCTSLHCECLRLSIIFYTWLFYWLYRKIKSKYYADDTKKYFTVSLLFRCSKLKVILIYLFDVLFCCWFELVGFLLAACWETTCVKKACPIMPNPTKLSVSIPEVLESLFLTLSGLQSRLKI